MGWVHFGRLGWSRFFLDEFKGIGMGEKRSEFFLEMVGFSGVFIDVVFYGDLDS